MKFLIRFFLSIAIAIVIICIGLWASGNAHLIKAVRSTYLVGKTAPTIDDYPKFTNRTVVASAPLPWKESKRFNQYQLKGELLKEAKEWQTSALLVIHKDSLLFEQYWDTYSENSLTNSFSMAKSFVSLAIGAAIKEGKIKSTKQKVSEFLPEFDTEEKRDIDIESLLHMSSGIDFGESYGDPFGFMAKAYYGEDLYDLTINKTAKYSPNEIWHYQGGNSLLLSFILKKATGKSLADYFAEKFWHPIGAKNDALWTINKEGGIERSYCCFYSNARDFARIGQLMLDSGKWRESTLITDEYYQKSLQAVNVKDVNGKLIDYYGYQWWMSDYEGDDFYYARGIQGQYIVWVPKWDMVIVRLGHKRDPTRNVEVPSDLYTYLKVGKESMY